MLSPHRHDLEIDNQKIKCGFINHLEFPQTEYICVDIIVIVIEILAKEPSLASEYSNTRPKATRLNDD